MNRSTLLLLVCGLMRALDFVVASALGQESLWIEAEHLDGIRGYCWPMGKLKMPADSRLG